MQLVHVYFSCCALADIDSNITAAVTSTCDGVFLKLLGSIENGFFKDLVRPVAGTATRPAVTFKQDFAKRFELRAIVIKHLPGPASLGEVIGFLVAPAIEDLRFFGLKFTINLLQ